MKYAAKFAVIMLILTSITGCALWSEPTPSCGDILLLLCDGVRLDGGARVGDAEYDGNEALFYKLYGDAFDAEDYDGFALCVPWSSEGVGEIGIFALRRDSDARKTLIMLRERIKALENKKIGAAPILLRRGRILLYAATRDNDAVREIFERECGKADAVAADADDVFREREYILSMP